MGRAFPVHRLRLMAKASPKPQALHLRPLAPYEDRLLTALAFFRTGRQPSLQAHHCLSMYLRQAEGRVLSEVGFYAQRCGYTTDEFLELIYTDPEAAWAAIAPLGDISPVAADEPTAP